MTDTSLYSQSQYIKCDIWAYIGLYFDFKYTEVRAFLGPSEFKNQRNKFYTVCYIDLRVLRVNGKLMYSELLKMVLSLFGFKCKNRKIELK